MKITLIGAGNLATNLGKALFHAGHEILQVYSRTNESAEPLAAVLNSQPIVDLSLLNPQADVYVIAVKDSVLRQLLPDVCAVNPDAVFAHTAGSMPMDCFKDIAVHYGVFYPMQTFSKSREVDFSVIPCFLEASDEKTAHTLQTMAESVSHDVRFLSSVQRKYMHLAAVFACNFTNHCYALAEKVLTMCDVPFQVLLPLIDETAAKVHDLPPRMAQTGPAVRYDTNVIDAQAQLLADDSNLKQIYEQLSKSIHQTTIEEND
ncbi:MAG: DUF2520 domain-containing protein [Prevotella sp.]|nr:DUF2520 domain-containing protein [Prevotella sp.]